MARHASTSDVKDSPVPPSMKAIRLTKNSSNLQDGRQSRGAISPHCCEVQSMRLTSLTTTLLLITVIALGAAASNASSPDTVFPVSVENCGISTAYADAPKRAFTMNQAATEIMLALGLQDRMVGTAFLDDAILPEFADAYNAIRVRTIAYPSRDVLLGARPDFVYAAYPSAFSDEVPGMLDLLQSGTARYLSPSGCERRSRTSSESTEMVFGEIRDIARIFGVLPRAEQLISAYRSDLESIRSQIGAVTTPRRVFWWDSAMPPFAAGCCGTPNEILRMAGAQNVFHDVRGTWGTVSWDEVIARDPEVIVLVDASWAPAAQKQQWLLTNTMFAGVDAVKHHRFVTVSFSDATPGVRNIATVRKVATALYPEKFNIDRLQNSTSK
jgi:iron complex transport system substrate-binding protein